MTRVTPIYTDSTNRGTNSWKLCVRALHWASTECVALPSSGPFRACCSWQNDVFSHSYEVARDGRVRRGPSFVGREREQWTWERSRECQDRRAHEPLGRRREGSLDTICSAWYWNPVSDGCTVLFFLEEERLLYANEDTVCGVSRCGDPSRPSCCDCHCCISFLESSGSEKSSKVCYPHTNWSPTLLCLHP